MRWPDPSVLCSDTQSPQRYLKVCVRAVLIFIISERVSL